MSSSATAISKQKPMSLKPKLMSLKEWGDLDEDIEGELVDGVLEEEEMATFLHELVVMWLASSLRAWARRRHGYIAGSEAKIVVGARRGRKPDLSLYLRGNAPALMDTLVRKPPHLVVEVLSPRPRDARRDRVDKIADYAAASIRYYWIVDPQLRTLEVFARDAQGPYRLAVARSEGRVRIPGCPGLVLNLDELWAEVDEAESQERTHRKKR